MKDNYDNEKHRRELQAFVDMSDELFSEDSEARTLNGFAACDLLEGTRIIPGPADESGEVPVYLIKPDAETPTIALPIRTKNIEGIPAIALAVILMHRLQGESAAQGATPVDEGAARAMGKVLQWLGVKVQLERLMEE